MRVYCPNLRGWTYVRAQLQETNPTANLASALIVGAISGWFASLLMARDKSTGILWLLVVGGTGSMVGNLLSGTTGTTGTGREFSVAGVVLAALDAISLLVMTKLIRGDRVG